MILLLILKKWMPPMIGFHIADTVRIVVDESEAHERRHPIRIIYDRSGGICQVLKFFLVHDFPHLVADDAIVVGIRKPNVVTADLYALRPVEDTFPFARGRTAEHLH